MTLRIIPADQQLVEASAKSTATAVRCALPLHRLIPVLLCLSRCANALRRREQVSNGFCCI